MDKVKQHQQQQIIRQRQDDNNNKQSNSQSNQPIRLNIEESNQNYSITAEELHAERVGEFEKQLSQKQNEFNSLMIQEIPQEVNFSDVKDSPIGSEMEQLIANTLKQRNFDIEQIHNANTNNDSTWLTSTETSLKSEKINSGLFNKHISWSTELISEEPVVVVDKKESIFSKLKQVKVESEPSLKEINDKLDKIIKHFNIV